MWTNNLFIILFTKYITDVDAHTHAHSCGGSVSLPDKSGHLGRKNCKSTINVVMESLVHDCTHSSLVQRSRSYFLSHLKKDAKFSSKRPGRPRKKAQDRISSNGQRAALTDQTEIKDL